MGRLPQQLYLLEAALDCHEAKLPNACFVRVEPGRSTTAAPDEATRFAERITAMYLGWGEKRRMRVRVLQSAEDPNTTTIAVSGFGALRILEPERGLHMLEVPGEHNSSRKLNVNVSVAPSSEAWTDKLEVHAAEADEALRSDCASATRVVRRYREKPSPLVRDSVRGWRTGLIDAVYAGDFDLIS